MYLSQIDIFGFKSFLEKTSIKLEKDKITVIVGPNGCGKSNVFDAVRWAIGETSGKLRVATSDNVIFAGSEKSAAVNLSQVHLHFINDDQRNIAKYGKMHEFQISRKLFRDGNNQYYINLSPCRLLDVKTLLMDLGVSYAGYSFIEQGNVTQIIQSKPEEKRQIIEEAAGLMKFKTLKKDSENKLNNTESNLNRIEDIRLEFQAQHDKLAKQAKVVDDYLKIKGRIEFLRKMNLATQWKNVNDKFKTAVDNKNRHLTGASEDKLVELNNNLALLENKFLIKEQAHKKTQHNYQKISQELQKLTNKWQLNNQLFNKTQSWIDKSKEEANSLEQKIQEKEQELASIKNKKPLNLLDNSGLQDCKKQITKLNQKYQDITSSKEPLIKKEQKITLELTAKQSLVDFQTQKIAKTTITTDFNSIRKALIGCWLEQKTSKKKYFLQKSAVASKELKLLEVETSYRESQENQKTIQKKYNQLQNYILQTKQTSSYQNNIFAKSNLLKNFEPLRDKNGFVGFFSELFSIRAEAPREAFHFFDNFLHIAVFATKQNLQAIINDLEKSSLASLDLLFLDELPNECLFANSLAKEIIFAKNLTLKEKNQLQSFFSLLENTLKTPPKTNKIFYSKKISSVFPYLLKYKQISQATLSEKYTKNHLELKELANNLATAKIDLSKTESVKQHITMQLLDYEKKTLLFKEQIKQQGQKTSTLQDSYWQSQMIYTQKKQEVQRIRKEQKEIVLFKKDLIIAKAIILQATADKKQILTNIANLCQEQEALQIELNQQQEKQQNLEKKQDNYRLQNNFIDETATRVQNELTYNSDLFQKKQQQIIDWQKSTQNTEKLAELQQKIADEQKQKTEQFELLENIKKEMLWIESEKKELQQKKAELSKAIENEQKIYYESELKINTLFEKQKNFEEQLQENYTTTAKEVLRYFQDDDFNLDTAKIELQQLQRKMPLFVNVNLGAKEEYKELKKKLEFYNTQKQDLTQSLLALRESILEIEKNSKDSFYDTFKQINESFQKLFEIVFGGGKAALILDNEKDLLNTGVEIFAQPLGKKMQNLTLLSSGEKSLIGLIFVFAILQINPSIFCFLDEVDAALDSVNVERIIAVIKEIAKNNQIVLITHNQKTILVGDVVLGVTMLNEGVSRIFSINLKEQKEQSLID